MDPAQTPPNNQPDVTGAPGPEPAAPFVSPAPDVPVTPPADPTFAAAPPAPAEPAVTAIPVSTPADPIAPVIPAFEPGVAATPAEAAPQNSVSPLGTPPVAQPADGGAVSPAAVAAATAYPSVGQPAPVAGAPFQATSSAAAGTGKKKKMIILGGGAAALLLVVVVIVMLFTSLGGGLKLEKITEDKFSILVPKGYVRSAEDSSLKFEEPEGEDETKSFVVAMAEEYPRTPTEEEKKQLLEVFEKQVPVLMRSFSTNDSEKVEDVTTEKVTHKGKSAIRIKAKLSKDDKRAEVDMLVVVGDKGLYVAGTAVHAEDTDLAKKSNEIINSLEFSE